MKRAGVYAAVLLASVLCVWCIMSPNVSSDDDAMQSGLNTSIPDPRGAGIVSDMESAYRQSALLAEQAEKMRAAENTALFSGIDGAEIPAYRDSSEVTLPIAEDITARADSHNRRRTLHSSDDACLKLSRTLEDFYDSPRNVEHTSEKKTAVSPAPTVRHSTAPTYDEQVALLEKSYELAAKYMGSQSGGGTADADCKSEKDTVPRAEIDRIEACVVSSLMPADSVECTERLRTGFHTAVGSGQVANKNTVGACVHCDQTVTDGQSLKMRLTEDMAAGDMIVPRNTPVVGICSIQGERLFISVISLKVGGKIVPVDIEVYDNDGQRGIHIPDSAALSAAKEAVADAGHNVGTTVSVSGGSAGGQILSELGKSAVQATSRYIAGRMRVVKVRIGEGYEIMLYQNKKQNYE